LVAADWRIHKEQETRLTATQGAVRISLFGDFSLASADGTPLLLSNRRSRALLAMLALEQDRPLARETLTRLLWPGRFDAQAKASLRQCLLELGKALAAGHCSILSVTRDQVGLMPGTVQTDLGDLQLALAVGDIEQAIAILNEAGQKPLLDQNDMGENFDQWRHSHCSEIERRIGADIEDAIARLQRAGNDPTAARLRHAWALRSGQPLPAPRATVADERIRIAVLPFQAFGRAGEADYFVDGIAEELISTLGQVPQLSVTGRTSAFHFRNSDLPLSEIAAALNVSHVIEGSVQRADEQVRVHVHLIDGESGFELWGGRTDGSLDGIFQLQEKVAQAVTRAMASALEIAMPEPQVRGMTHSKAAYDLYLQGRALCARIFGDGVLDTAVTLFEKALALDPDFAECWVALAEAHQLVSVYTQCPDRNGAAAKMADCARRAIALSPNLAYAYSLLGVYELTRFNFTGGLDYGYQAHRLDPDDPAVAMRLAYFLIFIGRTRDAAPYIKAAVDRDPVDGRKYALLCGVHFCMGDLEAARVAAQRMVDLGMPSIPLGVVLAALGKHDVAIEQYRLTQSMVNGMILPPVGIGVQTPEAMDAYWMMAAKGICGGKDEDRRAYWQVLEMLYAVLPDKSDSAISGPAIFTGNADLTFRALGHSITTSNLMAIVYLWADVEPIRQIWQHPEFIPFAQRIGIAAAWDKYGWPDLLPVPSNR
jgi:TolB-like protein